MKRSLLSASAAALLLTGASWAQTEGGGATQDPNLLLPPAGQEAGSGQDGTASPQTGAEQPAAPAAETTEATGESAGGAEQPATAAEQPADAAADVNAGAEAGAAQPTGEPPVQGEAAQEQPAEGEASEGQAAGEQPAEAQAQGEAAEGQGGGGDQAGKGQAAESGKQKADGGDRQEAKAEIAPEQRTVIRERIVEQKVEPVVDIDFEISIGTTVPQTIAYHPLPPTIVEVVPAWSGYMFFVLADGTIVIVDPGVYRIVYVIAA